jgi:hypothetical protein
MARFLPEPRRGRRIAPALRAYPLTSTARPDNKSAPDGLSSGALYSRHIPYFFDLLIAATL